MELFTYRSPALKSSSKDFFSKGDRTFYVLDKSQKLKVALKKKRLLTQCSYSNKNSEKAKLRGVRKFFLQFFFFKTTFAKKPFFSQNDMIT